jgi:hypothetical protein
LPKLGAAIASPERIQAGLKFVRDYYHANGVTLGSEPGGLMSKPLQDAQNAVLGDSSSPFRFYFIADGKSITAKFPDARVGAETAKLLGWGQGMTAFLPKQVKLFADGSIFSQAMQLSQSYSDGHKGEWMMDPEFFARSFRVYWDLGYQIHVHVNGDAGLDMVLNQLEANLQRNPRTNHRTVMVHFAVSRPDQVARIKRLGAIVSGNPYYPVALADNYRVHGLGPERADAMVRMGDVERAGISYSYHSDMPMAPGQPLFLVWPGVNRITNAGNLRGAEQRVSPLGALRAVTLDAAYSLQLENQVGSIVPGKLANFTILAASPLKVDPVRIKDITVWGTVQEGRVLPVRRSPGSSGISKLGPVLDQPTLASVNRAEAVKEQMPGTGVQPKNNGDPINPCRSFRPQRISAALLAVAPFINRRPLAVLPGKHDPFRRGIHLQRLPPQRFGLADPHQQRCPLQVPIGRQGAAGFVHVVHHQATGLGLRQQRQLQPVAQGHRQHQAAAGDAIDGADGQSAADPGHLLNGPIEVLPAEVAHRRQGRLPILGFDAHQGDERRLLGLQGGRRGAAA